MNTEIHDDNVTANTTTVETAEKTSSNGGGIAFVIIFNLLVGIWIWLCLLVFCVGLLGAGFGMIAAVIGIFTSISAWGPFMATGILLAITLIFAAITAFGITYFAAKYYFLGLGSYIKWNAKLCKEGF